MATYNLFLSASQADDAITNAYRLFDSKGLTGQTIRLYGGNIEHWGTINSTKINITGDIGEESFINRLTGGIRVQGDCEFDRILNGVEIYGTSYIQSLTSGLNVSNGGANITGGITSNGTLRNIGSTFINGSTTITGQTRVVGNSEFLGNFYQSGVFDVVSSDAEFRGNVDITGSLDVFGRTNIVGQTTINGGTGGLTVSGPTTINGTTNVVGTFLVNGQVPVTQQITQITENRYFLTGGECLEALTGGGGGVIQLDNLALRANNEGVANGVAGTTFGTPLPGLAMRGSGAVDLQMFRNSNVQIASGRSSAILAGESNMASGIRDVVIGGIANTGAGGNSVIIGGQRNVTSHPYSIILGGDRGRTYNYGEVVMPGYGGQKGNVFGFYSSGSAAPDWGELNISSGLYLPAGKFVSINIRAIYQSGCSFGNTAFTVFAGRELYDSYSTVFSVTPSQVGNFDIYAAGDRIFIIPDSFDKYHISLNADIFYGGSLVGCETTTNAPIAFNSDPDLDTLFS